ncbi:MAG: site-specific integrase [Oscillospiraceae bacterium]|jgi:integrase|nr:site-specific integrase [Oscillospiraceae bacterium]
MPKNKDGYYRTTFVVGKNTDGKWKRITVRAKTKKEHDVKLAEAKRLHSHGYNLADMTVNDWADRWHTVYKANASESQKRHYRVKLDSDILPIIGSMRMRDVRASHLQEILNDRSGGKAGTVKKIKIALKQLFEDAEIEGIIERSPAVRLELPDMSVTVRRPLTDFERSVVFNVSEYHKMGAYILTLLFCGLRRGECIALKVGDVDFERTRINVSKALSFRKNVGAEKGTKSQAGVREVPIPDILIPILKSFCAGRKPDEYLFSKVNGMRATQTTCAWWWKSFLRQCHITAGAKQYRNKIIEESSPFSADITPHYFRHTYATDLYAAGVDEKAQKYFLGHASTDVTDIYRKMNDTAFNRAARLLNDYYSKLDLKTP